MMRILRSGEKMKMLDISDFSGGWILGDFVPSVHRTQSFEFAVKYFLTGQTESEHYQKKATELTVVTKGFIRLADYYLKAGEMLLIESGEVADFEALEDSIVIAVKWPSLPNDKVIVNK